MWTKEERERQIAEVEEEIARIEPIIFRLRGEIACNLPGRQALEIEHGVWRRIIAYPKARLTELKQGLKGVPHE